MSKNVAGRTMLCSVGRGHNLISLKYIYIFLKLSSKSFVNIWIVSKELKNKINTWKYKNYY